MFKKYQINKFYINYIVKVKGYHPFDIDWPRARPKPLQLTFKSIQFNYIINKII